MAEEHPPVCKRCESPMTLMGVVPGVRNLRPIRSYKCATCGVILSLEERYRPRHETKRRRGPLRVFDRARPLRAGVEVAERLVQSLRLRRNGSGATGARGELSETRAAEAGVVSRVVGA